MTSGARTVVKTASGLMSGRVYAVVCLLACALLFAKTLGVMHRAVHSPYSAPEAAGHAAHANYGHVHDHVHGQNINRAGEVAFEHAFEDGENHDHGHALTGKQLSNWPSPIFAHDNGSDDCRLMDCAALANNIKSSAATVYIAPTALFLIAYSQVAATARASELFEARGPPATR